MLNTNLTDKTQISSDRSNIFRDRLAKNSDLNHNTFLAVLPNAIEILKYKLEMGRGRVRWAYYLTKEGKKIATFISPKVFKGYRWFDEFSTVVNMESGEIYKVSDRHCTCKSWEYHVKSGKRKTCKHQRMRQLEIMRDKFPIVNLSDSLPSIPQQSQPPRLQVVPKPEPQPTHTEVQARFYKVDLSSLKEGLTFERTKDLNKIEYYLRAWHKNTPLSAPALKKIGSIAETAEGFIVATIGLKKGVLKQSQEDAINWILRRIETTYALVYEAYIEAMDSQKARSSLRSSCRKRCA